MVAPLVRLWAATAVAVFLLATLPAGIPRPDVVLLLLAPTAMRGGRNAAAWYGFGGGLLLGLLGPGPAGLFAAVYGITGVVLSILSEEGAFMELLAVAVGTVMVGLLLAAAAGAPLLAPGAPLVPVLRAWLPSTFAANLLLALPARWLFTRVAGERAFRQRGLEL